MCARRTRFDAGWALWPEERRQCSRHNVVGMSAEISGVAKAIYFWTAKYILFVSKGCGDHKDRPDTVVCDHIAFDVSALTSLRYGRE